MSDVVVQYRNDKFFTHSDVVCLTKKIRERFLSLLSTSMTVVAQRASRFDRAFILPSDILKEIVGTSFDAIWQFLPEQMWYWNYETFDYGIGCDIHIISPDGICRQVIVLGAEYDEPDGCLIVKKNDYFPLTYADAYYEDGFSYWDLLANGRLSSIFLSNEEAEIYCGNEVFKNYLLMNNYPFFLLPYPSNWDYDVEYLNPLFKLGFIMIPRNRVCDYSFSFPHVFRWNDWIKAIQELQCISDQQLDNFLRGIPSNLEYITLSSGIFNITYGYDKSGRCLCCFERVPLDNRGHQYMIVRVDQFPSFRSSLWQKENDPTSFWNSHQGDTHYSSSVFSSEEEAEEALSRLLSSC